MKRAHRAPTEPPARLAVGAKVHGSILVEIERVAYAPEA